MGESVSSPDPPRVIVHYVPAQFVHFTVWGDPVPKGSMRAYTRKRRDGSVGVGMADGSPEHERALKAWEQSIAYTCKSAMNETGVALVEKPGAVWMEVAFWLERPVDHIGKTGAVLPSAPVHHTVKPDRDKLLRAVQDALTGIAYTDDAQVVDGPVSKRYTMFRPHVTITVKPLTR